MESNTRSLLAYDDPPPVKRTVSLNPFCDRMISLHQATMLKHGWRGATYSRSLNIILVCYYLDHEDGTLHKETLKRCRRYLDGKLKLGQRDLEKCERVLERLAAEPDFNPKHTE